MGNAIQLVGPNQALQLFGVKLVGVNADNAKKLLFSLTLIIVLHFLSRAVRGVMRQEVRGRSGRVAFWTRQGVSITVAVVTVLGLISIWFDNPARLTTAVGLVTAGLAFALQRVVTAFAGYILILRGNTFSVGDRITMGGVRGDVIALNFLQTVIMEMGQPPTVQSADPAMWVQARQYSGRIVTVTNAKLFDEPVYNYTRDFPYIWEEMQLPVPYGADRKRAEEILLEAARKHTTNIAELSEEALVELERRYAVRRSELGPKVYYRLTDNWLEMSVRFVVEDHGIRDVKSAMSRDILDGLDQAGIGVASGTYDVVGFPTVKVQMVPGGEDRGAVQ